ncbi:transposable element Tc1 transposase [Caerostris darwini]|uniref:Transposable element Tc1 transposase n=1 Tax=Caerostris darwini TaxID=1538125 RepID=A0AAV4SJK4_9ARAC|nr:transposable element Tc1 transposase [Caerostris darwini]
MVCVLAQFYRIDEDESIKVEDKFQYWLSLLKSNTKARDIVESYSPSKENYSKVIEHLKSRFGRKDSLIEVYIRDLLALVNSKTNIKVSDLYDTLCFYLRALETLGVTTSNYTVMLYPVVESCLPVEILKAWDQYRLNREVKEDSILMKEKVLENLMSFLCHEIEGEEHRVLAETAFGNGMKRKETHKPVYKDEPTTATVIANSCAGKNNCVSCDRSHPSQECQKISNMHYDDRKEQIMRKRCCLVCLMPGHMTKKCHSNVRCLICERRHYVFTLP